MGASGVALGPTWHAPQGGSTPYSLWGVLRVCSRPHPRSRPEGWRHPRIGGFPHISPTSGPESRRTGGGV